MADTTLTPGSQTSEFTLTKLVMYAGLTIDGLGILLESLQNAGLHFGWLPTVMVVVGSALTLVKALGYTRSRTMLKLAEAAPTAATADAAIVPLLQALREEVKALNASPAPSLSTLPPPPSI